MNNYGWQPGQEGVWWIWDKKPVVEIASTVDERDNVWIRDPENGKYTKVHVSELETYG